MFSLGHKKRETSSGPRRCGSGAAVEVERRPERCLAFTLVEVVVAVLLLAIMALALFAGFSTGFDVVRQARENLRATQIMVQRMEDIRLYTWDQVTNPAYMKPTFVDWYYPAGTNTGTAGTCYQGSISVALPANVPSAYQQNLRAVTITLSWTNYPGGASSKAIVRSRQMQSQVAYLGMQNYVSR